MAPILRRLSRFSICSPARGFSCERSLAAWASGPARDAPLVSSYSTRKSDEKRKSAGKWTSAWLRISSQTLSELKVTQS